MHYKHKKTAKVDSSSFYLSTELLNELDELSFIYNISRNNAIEWALRFYLRGDYERAKRKAFKKKKKVFTKKRNLKRVDFKGKKGKKEPELPFDFST